MAPDKKPDLSGKRVLVAAGTKDPLVTIEDASKLASALEKYNADVTLKFLDEGHSIGRKDIEEARKWMNGIME